VTTYGRVEHYWTPLGADMPARAAAGLAHSVVGGHFLFALPGVRSSLLSWLSTHSLSDEMFLVRDMAPSFAALLLICSIAAGLGLATMAIQSLRTARLSACRMVIACLAAWFTCYSTFFFFWDSMNAEFWIPQSLCVWLLLLAIVGSSDRSSTAAARRIAVLALLLATVNYFGSIRLARDPSRDYYRRLVEPLSAAAQGDLVVLPDAWIVRGYVTRLTPADVVTVRQGSGPRTPADYARVRRAIEGALASRHTVFVDSGLFRSPDIAPAGGWSSYRVDRMQSGATERSFVRIGRP
jgi:hypothetical protein